MENLKIRVDSKSMVEVLSIFRELGYHTHMEDHKHINKGAKALYAEKDEYGSGFDYVVEWDEGELFNESNHKEITLPQLRDMVVLKRNDVKKEMKEYLDPKKNHELCLSHEDLTKDGMIKIPEGAEIATKGIGKVNFWKNQDREFYFNSREEWSNNCGETLSEYLGRNPEVEIVWQRTTQNKEIEQEESKTGIEATLSERQSTYGSFEDVSFVTENIVSILKKCNYEDMPHTHRMSMYMIASKMARLVCGDHNHLDSWHDIGGYAKLVEDLIKENKNG